MIDLRNFTLAELQDFVADMGQPEFRAKQIYNWIYRGVKSFREMKNLPEAFLNELEKKCSPGTLTLEKRQMSKEDGTQKFLFVLEDGHKVESVFMKYKYGNSVCISSQAGCRMGCKFCASGLLGLARNLTAGELVSQVMDIENITGERVSRVVVMGTGEPFDNYENLSKFLSIMNDSNGRNMGMRNFTVSTCGLVPEIEKFAKDFPQVNLAISLHAVSDDIRSEIMPVNNRYNISELMAQAKKYTEITHRRVTFEFALIKGINDDEDTVKALEKLVSCMLCHINLIPLNEVSENGLKTAGRSRALEICGYLERHGIPCTVRRQLGADISGACGQLRLDS